jgi:hypothetical protein
MDTDALGLTSSMPVCILSADARVDQIGKLKSLWAGDSLIRPLDITKILSLLDEEAQKHGLNSGF